jgi:hypothetical protein
MWPDAAPTPEDAARGEIPERYARALGVVHSPDGNHAVVLLGTNESPFLYPYQVVCGRGEGGWYEGMSGNGPGWSTTSSEGEPNIGVATLWDEAPPGATAAVVSFEGHEHECPSVRAISSSRRGMFPMIWRWGTTRCSSAGSSSER